FKTINDRLGHHTGDRVLREVGQLLMRHVREYDVVVRYGGDEFLLILSETDDEADVIVARIREVFLKWVEDTDWLTVPVSLAMGIARWDPAGPLSWERAVRESDRAMYEDKKAR
ncbi:MAG: GGDEF domain-containing protein, partial [Thermoanaerobaculales bacterium]|nr:GGDEF domain-containing protein [Thermoanaerobaculales bacterium]